jgi:hypothetical protein
MCVITLYAIYQMMMTRGKNLLTLKLIGASKSNWVPHKWGILQQKSQYKVILILIQKLFKFIFSEKSIDRSVFRFVYDQAIS